VSAEVIFVNDLRLSVQKDNVKKFILNNIGTIVAVVLLVFITGIFCAFASFYRSNKIKEHNMEMYLISDLTDLENLYNKKSIPQTSKTFVGLKLVSMYKKDGNNPDRITSVYEDIFKNEKDVFFKNYAGLNLLISKINQENYSAAEISELILVLENKENPLLNLVMEQKALFLMRENRKEDAKNILKDLAKKEIDIYLRERIDEYLILLE
jgi:hypothetical protein